MKFTTTAATATLLAGLSLFSLPGSALAEGPATMGPGADISALCGDKPLSIALIDGYGSDTWRKITHAELEDEASKCSNIKRLAYSDAGGDPQKYNSDINSYVAQGFDIIIALTDFGDAAIPAYRAAQHAGVTMVPYFSPLSGKVGTDYAANVYQDQAFVGGIWADWLGQNLKKGNVVLLGGPAGAASSQHFMDGFTKRLAKYPDLKLLDPNYILTNWNPADGQKAVAGLIAKYGQIDGIASDYGVTTLAAVKAFEQAGLPIPAQATLASNNELNCKYDGDLKAGKRWPYLTLDGTTTLVRFALRRALADHNGIKLAEPQAIIPFPNGDSFRNISPRCDETAPPDADLSSLLPERTLRKIFGK